jgi:hypothetical protein
LSHFCDARNYRESQRKISPSSAFQHFHWNVGEILDQQFQPVSTADVDLQQAIAAVTSTSNSTTQFLNIDVTYEDCETLVRRISYRLNFCVLIHDTSGTFGGSFKYFSLLKDGSYYLGQYLYTTQDCTGTAETNTLSSFAVSASSCGDLTRSSLTSSGVNGYYYSLAYDSGTDDNVPQTAFQYKASVSTSSAADDPTSYGILFK